MTRLTDIERRAIQGILDSDYMDGDTGTDTIDRPVWTWDANPFDSKRTFSGAVSSLVRKGFVVIDGTGNDATIQITQAGYNAFHNIVETYAVALYKDGVFEGRVSNGVKIKDRDHAQRIAKEWKRNHGDLHDYRAIVLDGEGSVIWEDVV